MSFMRNTSIFVSVLLIVVGIASVLAGIYASMFMSYADMQIALTVTTETFGVLLGIITAGLMFTQGKFSELSSDLNTKSPDYLTNILSLKRIQAIETHLLYLRKTFTKLMETAIVTEERNLYESIVTKTSSIFVDLAVLLNLKLKQQELPITGLLISEMEPSLYMTYEKASDKVKKEWQLFSIIRRIITVWEGSASFVVEKSRKESSLQTDIKGSISILKLKESVDKSSKDICNELDEVSNALSNEINDISKRFRQDRIPQLLSQMEHAGTVRGKYFYLTVIFITAPLLINLMILPQLAQTTAALLRPIISVTSMLSIMAVMFLLLYIFRILDV